jgi:DNA repair ATPase RecN
MAKKAKAVKKLEIVDLWSTAKQLARKGCEKEAREDARDFKDDPEELEDLKTRVQRFEDLYKSFDDGLSKKLKGVEDEKDLKKMLAKAREALQIVKSYQQKVSAVAGQIGNPQATSTVLSGALERVKTRLEEQIDVLTDAV